MKIRRGKGISVCVYLLLMTLFFIGAGTGTSSADEIELGDTSKDDEANGVWSWVVDDRTLTLTGNEDGSTLNDHFVVTIAAGDDVTIKVNGDVTIEAEEGYPAIEIRSNVNVIVEGANESSEVGHLTLIGSDGLYLSANKKLTINDVTLVARALGEDDDGIGTYGYAGIWTNGDLVINNAIVTATAVSGRSNNESNNIAEKHPAIGILAMGSIEIKGRSNVTASGRQIAESDGGRAAGIFALDGDIEISGTATVDATARSECASAAGIYSEKGSVVINSTGKVTSTGTSNSAGGDENTGSGIAAGVGVEIGEGDSGTVEATGSNLNNRGIGVGVGIAAAVTPLGEQDWENGGGVTIDSGTVTAEGIGTIGHGIAVEGDDEEGAITIGEDATLTAIAHGGGYALNANAVTNDSDNVVIQGTATPGGAELSGGGHTFSFGPQRGTLTAGTAGSATFSLTTTGFDEGEYSVTLEVVSANAGITLNGTSLAFSADGNATIRINTTSAVAAGTYDLRLNIGDEEPVESPIFELTVGAQSSGAPDDPEGGATKPEPKEVTDGGTIVEIVVDVSNETATITYKSGEQEVIDLKSYQAKIELDEGRWASALSSDGKSLAFTAAGNLIPIGRSFTITATPITGAVTRGAGKITATGKSSLSDKGDTVITITFDATGLDAGFYKIEYASEKDTDNPYYSGILASKLEVKASPSNGNNEQGDKNDGSPGGCDAGFTAMSILAAAGAMALKKRS